MSRVLLIGTPTSGKNRFINDLIYNVDEDSDKNPKYTAKGWITDFTYTPTSETTNDNIYVVSMTGKDTLSDMYYIHANIAIFFIDTQLNYFADIQLNVTFYEVLRSLKRISPNCTIYYMETNPDGLYADIISQKLIRRGLCNHLTYDKPASEIINDMLKDVSVVQ